MACVLIFLILLLFRKKISIFFFTVQSRMIRLREIKKKSFFSQELLHFHQTLLQKGSGDCREKKNTSYKGYRV